MIRIYRIGHVILVVDDSGNYCDNGKTPCGLTAYERDLLGWRPLTVLERSTTVRLRPLEAGGVGYKVVNEANPDEYTYWRTVSTWVGTMD